MYLVLKSKTENFVIIINMLAEIDECLSSPCVHGVCNDRNDGYVCQCEEGWHGVNCDIG